MKGRFDYVKYDEKATEAQAIFKTEFEKLESLTDGLVGEGRAKALVFTKLEEAYMWIGKAIRDDQVKRNAGTTLNETRA